MGGLHIPILLTIGLDNVTFLAQWNVNRRWHTPLLSRSFQIQPMNHVSISIFPSIMSPATPLIELLHQPQLMIEDNKWQSPSQPWWTRTCEREIYFHGLNPLHLGGLLLLHINIVTPTDTNNVTQWLRGWDQQTVWPPITIPSLLFTLLKFSFNNLTFE